MFGMLWQRHETGGQSQTYHHLHVTDRDRYGGQHLLESFLRLQMLSQLAKKNISSDACGAGATALATRSQPPRRLPRPWPCWNRQERHVLRAKQEIMELDKVGRADLDST